MADVREGIDAEKGEGRLRFFEFDVAEEEFRLGRGILVVGDESRGDEAEFVAEVMEMELVLVVELDGIEENEERVRSRFCGGQEAIEAVVVEMDHTRLGSRLDVQELRDSVRIRLSGSLEENDRWRKDNSEEEEEVRESWN
uniref:Uncharacterized protein n=1 Tax=Nelumbo nucifera TaxID=4432 RepID=A0A822XGE8_NELNU|nr:TPA_asm: hypothetical protein HUJ06_022027 [Nelumbo nucifera]